MVAESRSHKVVGYVTPVTGCSYWSNCFTCPYPDCITSLPRGEALTLFYAHRLGEFDRIRAGARTDASAAAMMGVTAETVYRWRRGLHRLEKGKGNDGNLLR